MTSLMALNPGFPLVVEAATSLTAPVEAALGMLQILALVDEDVLAHFTPDGDTVHQGNASLEKPEAPKTGGSTKRTIN